MKHTAKIKATILAINEHEKIVHFKSNLKGRSFQFTTTQPDQLDLLRCVYPEIKEDDVINLEIKYNGDKNGVMFGAFGIAILPPENFTAQSLVDNMAKFIK